MLAKPDVPDEEAVQDGGGGEEEEIVDLENIEGNL